MSLTITLTNEYGYVVLSFFLTFLLHIFLSFRVGRARKEYKVAYPAAYGIAAEHGKVELHLDNAFKFNCVQRGHQNTLETFASFQLLLLFNGLFQPELSAFLGVVYCVGRVIYAIGYSESGPSGRSTGAGITHLADLPLILLTAYNGYQLLSS